MDTSMSLDPTKPAEPPKRIIDLENTRKRANDLFTDIKAEVFAAYLIEQGFPADYIAILRKGHAKRGWDKDIEGLSIDYSQSDLKDYLNVRVNRAGIYDILPEGLFHSAARNKRLNKDKEEIIDEIKMNRREEFFARRFFHFFENELDLTAVKVFLDEAKYDKRLSNPNFINVFVSSWPVLKLLERRQAIFFLHTIAFLEKIRNNYNEIAEAMAYILDVSIHIAQVKTQHEDVGNETHSVLGSHKMGVDWVLGRSFDDGLFDLKVSLGPLSGEEMRNFLPGSSGSIVLDYLCKLFLPANLFIIKEYIIEKKDAVFRLSKEEHSSYLGINTFL